MAEYVAVVASDELAVLDQQIAELASRRATLLQASRAEALTQVRRLMHEYQFSPTELGMRSGKSFVAPKYRNPQDQNQTWAGRGGQPQWVRQALLRGLTLRDLAV